MLRLGVSRGSRAEKPEVYPLRYTEDFSVKADEGVAPISASVAEQTFEMGSNMFWKVWLKDLR